MSHRGKRKRRCRKKKPLSLPTASRIYIDDDGSLTISSLLGDLVPLVKELGYINTNNKNESEVRKNGTDV
jgi:hypothetical protein